MPIDLQETRLPGVGTKFTMRLEGGARKFRELVEKEDSAVR